MSMNCCYLDLQWNSNIVLVEISLSHSLTHFLTLKTTVFFFVETSSSNPKIPVKDNMKQASLLKDKDVVLIHLFINFVDLFFILNLNI